MAKTNNDISVLLEKYERFGIDLSLDRIKTVLAQLGNPQERVPIVHVTGTNGKGSVCAYVSSVLSEAGYRVGRFISPHLVNWTERVCLNNQEVDGDRLYDAILQVEAACKGVQLTQFEVITAAAWLIFQQAAVDVAVIEVGLGGRLDATNVCDRPLVSVITSISLEHWQRLGSTLAAIASEKAGIIKAECPVVVGQLPAEAMKVMEAKAKDLHSLLIQPSPAQRIEAPEGESQTSWAIAQNIAYPLALQGDIQLHNSALAIAVIQILQNQGWQIATEAIQAGMAKTQWAGRLQWSVWQGKKLLIDGAHNPAAAQALRHYVDSLNPKQVHWLMGMLATKDHQAVFEALLRSGDRLSLVPVAGHASADVAELAAIAEGVCELDSPPQRFESLEQMLASWHEERGDAIAVLCGSLYMLGEFLRMLVK